uniref:gibberellin-regulated protein 12 isoform X2 n=1 Tax=Fragaria vesca subsp. vesca TaxID=101020 RepID=UPI0005C9C9E6|nr:PREDICTED: gibberellin-regulated protein 12 isoform X2 [Fragaria vesca subsp. vesca]
MASLSWISIAFLVIFAFATNILAQWDQSAAAAPAATIFPQGGEGSLKPERACDYRCSATSHKKPCLFFCNMCCQKCLCVPSGTYGHKEECPCYNDWKTQQGTPKCP